MEPLISVIIPVYNAAPYLARCLDSVIQNTYHNLEIICVDDGSKDDSLSILQSYAEHDSRITVIAKENGGVSAARNAGLSVSSGDFVSFLDSDDYVHPLYFELLIAAQQSTNADIIACDYMRTAALEPPNVYPGYSMTLSGLRKYSTIAFFDNELLKSYCWGRLFRAVIVNNIWFHEDIRFAEDSLFVAEIWEKTPELNCWLTDLKLYYYYDRPNSLVSSANGNDKFIIASLFLQKASISDHNEQIYLRQAVRRSLFYHQAYRKVNRSAARNCIRSLRHSFPLILKSALFTKKEKVRIAIRTFTPSLYTALQTTKSALFHSTSNPK